MSPVTAHLICARCGSTRTAPLSRLSTCSYCADAAPRPVSRRDTTLLHGEQDDGA